MKKILLSMLATAIGLNMATAQKVGDVSNVTDIDGNVYESKFMKDNNWWMMENLQVTKHPNGTPAKYVYPFNGTTNDASLVAQGAGLLYDRDSLMGWPHAIRAQGLCPDGWHVPSRAEVESFVRALGKEPTLWTGDGNWAPLISELNGAATRGGKWDPTGKDFTQNALNGWGFFFYTSTSAWGNKDIAFMVAIAADGTDGGVTQDPKIVAGNCRCVKNKDMVAKVSDLTDNGLKITLPDSIISFASQVTLFDITDPQDPYEVDLTSVTLSVDKKIVNVIAYLTPSEGNKYEVRFKDSQAPQLPLSGYNLTFEFPTSVNTIERNPLTVNANAATGMLYVTMDGLEKVSVFSTTGKLLFANNKLKGTAEFNLSGLSTGVYLIQATNSNGAVVNRKFFKK